MIAVTLLLLVKTVFFLRVIRRMTKLVIMINQVSKDLKEFVAFYGLNVVMFGVVFSILGYGHCDEANEECRRVRDESDPEYEDEHPGFEYAKVGGQFYANCFEIVRYSLGEFEFGSLKYFSEFEAKFFWGVWVIIVLFTCVVFMNFIIAEVNDSYSRVNRDVDGLISQQMWQLVDECEDMLGAGLKGDKKRLCKYIIKREIEN